MPSTTETVRQGKRERDLIDQWIRSASQTEIGLLDVVVLDEWISQNGPDGSPGRPD